MVLSEGQLDVLCNTLLKELKEKNIPHNLGREGGPERAKKILQRIHRDFQDQPILKKKFDDDFYNFFDYLLDWSYGLEFDRTKPGRPGFKKKERSEEDERRFLGKVDMFCLIDYLDDNYNSKRFLENINLGDKQQNVGEYIIEAGKDNKTVLTLKNKNLLSLEAHFNENFWENIYNDYPTYSETGGLEEVCLFNTAKYSIASYLHSADPYVHYLIIKSENKNYPNPLCTAILIECEGEQKKGVKKEYMVVEGVIGNLSIFKVSDRFQIYDFLWNRIQEFSFKKNKSIFVNTCHSKNQNEPHEFVEHISRKMRKIKGDLVQDEERKLDFRLSKPKKVLKEKDKAWFTHYFLNKTDPEFVIKVSNKSKNDREYTGEQYADTFYLSNKGEFPKKEHFNSFFELGGYAQGFEVAYQNRPLRKFLGILLPVVLFGLFSTYQDNNKETYPAEVIQRTSKQEVISELSALLKEENNGSIEDDVMALEEKHRTCFVTKIDNKMHCEEAKIVAVDIADLTDTKVTTWNYLVQAQLHLKTENGTKNIPLEHPKQARRIADLIETYQQFLQQGKKLNKCNNFSLIGVKYYCDTKAIPLYSIVNSGKNMQRFFVETDTEMYVVENDKSGVIEKGTVVKAKVEEMVRREKENHERHRHQFGLLRNYQEFAESIAESIPDTKLIFNLLDLLASYDTTRAFDLENNLSGSPYYIARWLDQEASSKRMPEKVESLASLLGRERVFNILKLTKETKQNDSALLGLLELGYDKGYYLENILNLSEYYLQRKELWLKQSEILFSIPRSEEDECLVPASFQYDNFMEFKSDGRRLMPEKTEGVKVLAALYSVLSINNDKEFGEVFVKIVEKIKVKKDIGDLLDYVASFMIMPRDKKTGNGDYDHSSESQNYQIDGFCFNESIPNALLKVINSYIDSKWLPEIVDYFITVHKNSKEYCLPEESESYYKALQENCVKEEMENMSVKKELLAYLNRLYHLPKIKKNEKDYLKNYHLCKPEKR